MQNFRREACEFQRLQGLTRIGWLGLASKTPHLPTFATSSPLGSAGALEMAARAHSAPLGRSK